MIRSLSQVLSLRQVMITTFFINISGLKYTLMAIKAYSTAQLQFSIIIRRLSEMTAFIIIFTGLSVLSLGGSVYSLHLRSINQSTSIVNQTSHFNVTQDVADDIETVSNLTLADFTYEWRNETNSFTVGTRTSAPELVDCFGLGTTVARTLEWLFIDKANGSNALDVRFFFSSRRRPQRVQVLIGKQFGLEWTDFKIERRTVIIIHGFLSDGELPWIADMERAFLNWDDVNVIVVDWSAGGNTLNYYKAAVNTRVVGYQVSSLIEHIINATIAEKPDVSKWGRLHLVGHSLGAHICGFTAKELKKRQVVWPVYRITGLDPAQPCFRHAGASMHLHKTDAEFLDVIHTNGRLLSNIGLGLPDPIGHTDFYPNGGKTQPGCTRVVSTGFSYISIPPAMIRQAVCSHGRSYIYLTESLISAANNNCTFWAHPWNFTYHGSLHELTEQCGTEVCTEMGINAENYVQRGSFFTITASTAPFCPNSTEVIEEVKVQLRFDGFSDLPGPEDRLKES